MINGIAILLAEIESIRRKYRLKRPSPFTDTCKSDDVKSLRKYKSTSTLSLTKPSFSFRQRVRENQRQKSFLTIAKWAICDARKFDEKVKRLKSLIDGLEDISKAAGIARTLETHIPNSSLNAREESPPPYSVLESSVSLSGQETVPPCVEPVSRTTPSFNLFCEITISEQYVALKAYLISSLIYREHVRPAPSVQDKLLRLSDIQFKELRTDVYDELMRRQQDMQLTLHSNVGSRPRPLFLPANPPHSAERNQAREKLSTLTRIRLGDLISDVVVELERRFPLLDAYIVRNHHFFDPIPVHHTNVSRRWDVCTCNKVCSPHSLLQSRDPHPSALRNEAAGTDMPSPNLSSRFNASSTNRVHISGSVSSLLEPNFPKRAPPPPPNAKPGDNIKIFKSFRVSMDDPTRKVLPVALKKYKINAPWDNYALCIVYEDEERCLGMDEKPLTLFKQLNKEGKRPVFLLRKLKPTVFLPNPGEESNSCGSGIARESSRC
jgi:hypothetical protein